jgi:signal transduction histidine kinase/DNA-binding response OmpR family regulator
MVASEVGFDDRVQRIALGMALGMRAYEIHDRVMSRLAPHIDVPVSPAYQAHRWGRIVMGTLLIGRWLVTGERANEEESAWISQGGEMGAAEGVSMALGMRGYYIWRDGVADVLREEAARLKSPPSMLEMALDITNSSCDASLFRMARAYDRKLRTMNSQLSEASHFKSEFLARMSHELRTPLSAIIGFCEILLEGIDGDLNAPQHDDVKLIHQSGRSLLALINDVLDLSKIEAGKVTILPEPLDLRDVVAEVALSLKPLAQAKGLTIVTEVADDANRVLGDRAHVGQVVTNLLSNALKFTHQGTISIGSQRRGDRIQVWVADTGIGMRREALDFIFDEFRQAEQGTTREYGGTGLGLAIARRLVQLQGGEMGVDSEFGTGSRFWFTLPPAGAVSPPVSPPAAGAVRQVAESLPGQTRDLVLVIEDDDSMRQVVVRRLRDVGFETAEANSAATGLRAARELHPAAVTLDILLPDASGWAVLADLKADSLTRDIPVIVVSIVDGREMALDLGAVDYVPKPVSQEALVAAISDVLPRLRGASIFCVDDEPAGIEPLRRTLEAAGANVTVVDSAEAALAWVGRQVPDVIFVDLMMPGMSGFELVMRLRSRPGLEMVPLIVLSGRTLDAADKLTLHGHVDRVILKGELRLGDLSATVRQALAHRRRRPALAGARGVGV